MKNLILFEDFEEEVNEGEVFSGPSSASGLAGQTLGTNWASKTNKVSDGSIDVPYNPGGSNRVFQKIPAPMGFNHGARTGKKTREKRLDLKSLRNVLSKRQDYTKTSGEGKKIMSFDNFEKDNINTVKR